MKTIGLLGGMSWESTVTYYQLINESINQKYGGSHSAKILLYSVDFQEIETCQTTGNWQRIITILTDAIHSLEKGGADFIAICSNTIHKVVPELQSSTKLPILHIVDATIEQLKKQHIQYAALLGTKYTMQQDFYKNKLKKSGIQVFLPSETDMLIVNQIIFEELCHGKILPSSKKEYLRIIRTLTNQGATGVILGCTEIGHLIHQEDISFPVFDTTKIHVEAIVQYALNDK
ncbi:aspartate/glutamate racemase family protein [Megasphaera paucivorans]|uniref:Aspartate racemase n=1 Tax=Megasphaera paucivorans TaxID=349095 RepID=A0A1G9QBM9_9FIRM|nr:aspartate/glutamate racemase family protein [Megasphaera paucivorans]SDM07857.1 aspartate racemase [Megasphaera paucivorans]